MDNIYMYKSLEANISVFQSLVQDIDKQQAGWKPDEKKWSVLEVINHLYDEEREDFRVRLDLILHHPEQDWPPIDPENWVIEREYNKRDFLESLAKWVTERKKSVDWLNNLSQPEFTKSYDHPKLWEIRAGDMLAAWLAHDFLHMRQIVNLKLEYAIQKSQPYSIKYAAP